MNPHKFTIFITLAVSLLQAFFLASTSFAQSDSISSLLLKLDSKDTHEVAEALELMGKVCDESCIPYIADNIHHSEPEIVIAASHAAQNLANPRFAPALKMVVQTHPLNEVRAEALKALLFIGREEDYDQLVDTMMPVVSDELKRHIIRHMPDNCAKKNLHTFAQLAKKHEFVTSVVHAYRYHPDMLFREILSLLQNEMDEQERVQLFRTLELITPDIQNPELSPSEQAIFENFKDTEVDSIARIQSSRSTHDSIIWLLLHSDKVTPATRLYILSHLKNHIAELYTNTIIQTQDDHLTYSKYIEPWSELENEFIDTLNRSSSQTSTSLDQKWITTKSYPGILTQVDRIHTDKSQKLITSMLGYSNPQIAQTAMRIISNNTEYIHDLSEIVLKDNIDDNAGKIWYARWALTIIASRHTDQFTDLLKEQLISHARNSIERPNLLHAEPEFWMLHALGIKIQPPSETIYTSMRSDMKAAWILVTDPKSQQTPGFIQKCLSDNTVAVRSAAIRYLIHHPDLADNIDNLDETIQSYLISTDIALETNIIALIGAFEKKQFIPILVKKLEHKNSNVVYNALWALQKLNALPNQQKLSAMYYQTSDNHLKTRLNFLAGLNDREDIPGGTYDLETGTHIHPGHIVHVLRQNEPIQQHDIVIVENNQSRYIYRTNLMGLLYL